jgi:hypothetical protein
MLFRIVDLPRAPRVALAGFALLVLGFALLAQVNLAEQDGGGSPPGPQAVLEKYNGRADDTMLHRVLDTALPADDAHAMWPYLGEPDEIEPRRKLILDWVARGAPESEWDTVAPIFTGDITCAQCHAPGGSKEDLPFETFADIQPFTVPGQGMSLGPLLISAHNHLFGFAVLALLLAVAFCGTRVPTRVQIPVIVAAFLGPALDIGGWFLTRGMGAPFHYLVILGGALFGLATTIMAVAVLFDALRIRRGGAAPAEAVDA